MLKPATITAALCLGVLATPAAAGIRCDGPYQLVNGRPVSTPFCQDEDLATRARMHGEKISGASLRNHPQLKRGLCTADYIDAACAAYAAD